MGDVVHRRGGGTPTAGPVGRVAPAVDVRAAEWDGFLEVTPGGSYRQTSAWAEVKALQGWETRRSVVRRDGRIVAGAQLLIKPLPVVPALGGIAYCGLGPVLALDDPELAAQLLEQLGQQCRRERVRVLLVQPPDEGPSLDDALEARGFVESPIAVAPRATALVDLRRDLATIEQDLGRSLRKQLRRAHRRDVVVREGDREDIAVFHRLLVAAGDRLAYGVFPLAYYERLWDAFGDARTRLFLAEHGGRTLSATMCLAMRDRVVSVAIGWGGEGAELHPNDVLDWHTIRWARERGYRYVELENLSQDLAVQLVAGADPATTAGDGSDRYKLKWATDVVVRPAPRLYVTVPFLRAVLRHVPLTRFRSTMKRLSTRFRPTAGGRPDAA
jgi:lipid II:glycine glycyltransferase (peptidoglycan interpeptide bridge formation enzyme)